MQLATLTGTLIDARRSPQPTDSAPTVGNVITTPDSLTASITPAAGTTATAYTKFTLYACARNEDLPDCANFECTPSPEEDCSTITVGGLTGGAVYFVSARATTATNAYDSTDFPVTLPYP